jgi:hypothetical protein
MMIVPVLQLEVVIISTTTVTRTSLKFARFSTQPHHDWHRVVNAH